MASDDRRRQRRAVSLVSRGDVSTRFEEHGERIRMTLGGRPVHRAVADDRVGRAFATVIEQ